MKHRVTIKDDKNNDLYMCVVDTICPAEELNIEVETDGVKKRLKLCKVCVTLVDIESNYCNFCGNKF